MRTLPNYACDNMPYVSGLKINETVRFLEELSRVILKWFINNKFHDNTRKCHMLLSTGQHVQASKYTFCKN